VTATVARDRPFTSAEEVHRLVAAFTDCSLPHVRWTHRAHLTVALWYATHHPPEHALELMREGIHRLNAAHGLVPTPTRGYHETITRLYMRVVARFVREELPEGDWATRANLLFERYGSRDLPLRHYSRTLLMSPAARASWVPPDLEPLP
jgi:hypothetical protein